MKYKIRYTCMTLLFCGLLGWDLAYEHNKPDLFVPPEHPVVHTIQHLMAPKYVPKAKVAEADAATKPPTTSTTTASTTPIIATTSTVPIITIGSTTSTSTPIKRPKGGRGRN